MKKIIYILGIVCFVTQVNAQVQKGTVMIGGNIGIYGTDHQDNYNASSFSALNTNKDFSLILKPQIGWFVSDRTQVGIAFEYAHNYTRQNLAFAGQDNVNISKRNLYTLNPYLTRYIHLTDKLYLTGSFNAMIGIGKGQNEQTTSSTQNGTMTIQSKSDIVNLEANFAPGITYFLSQSLAINASIGRLYYSYDQNKYNQKNSNGEYPKNKDKDYGLDISAKSLSFGMNYFF